MSNLSTTVTVKAEEKGLTEISKHTETIVKNFESARVGVGKLTAGFSLAQAAIGSVLGAIDRIIGAFDGLNEAVADIGLSLDADIYEALQRIGDAQRDGEAERRRNTARIMADNEEIAKSAEKVKTAWSDATTQLWIYGLSLLDSESSSRKAMDTLTRGMIGISNNMSGINLLLGHRNELESEGARLTGETEQAVDGVTNSAKKYLDVMTQLVDINGQVVKTVTRQELAVINMVDKVEDRYRRFHKGQETIEQQQLEQLRRRQNEVQGFIDSESKDTNAIKEAQLEIVAINMARAAVMDTIADKAKKQREADEKEANKLREQNSKEAQKRFEESRRIDDQLKEKEIARIKDDEARIEAHWDWQNEFLDRQYEEGKLNYEQYQRSLAIIDDDRQVAIAEVYKERADMEKHNSDQRLKQEEEAAKKILDQQIELNKALNDATSATLGIVNQDMQRIYDSFDQLIAALQTMKLISGTGGIWGIGGGIGGGMIPGVSSYGAPIVGSMSITVPGGGNASMIRESVALGVKDGLNAAMKTTLANETRHGGLLNPSMSVQRI